MNSVPVAVAIGVILAAAGGVAQDATPVFPASDLSLEAVVTSLMASVNVGVLVMLTIIATAVHRLAIAWECRPAVSTTLLIGLPIVMGGLIGAVSALGKAQMTTGGWVEISRLAASILEGATVNAGMAIALGAVISVGAGKIGAWLSRIAAGSAPPLE